MSLGRTLLTAAVTLVLLVGAAVGGAAQVEGSHWTSPTYGFRVSWQNTKWKVDPQGSLTAAGPERLDRLHLINGVSSLYFEGATRYQGDLDSCIAEEANILAQEDGVSNIHPYLDKNGAPFVANGPNSAAAAFALTLAVGQQQLDLVNYVECRTLVPGESVLIITLVTDPSMFDAQLQLAEDVAQTITLANEIPQDPLAAYGGWVAKAQASPSLVGPLSGEIAYGPGQLGVVRTGVNAPDFYARVEFANPAPSAAAWDVGIGFRDRGGEEQLRLIVDATGTWYLKDGLGPVIASGSLVDLDASPGGSNVIELVAVGDTGYFAFNERLVSALDLSSRQEGGDLFVGAGFFAEDAAHAGTIRYNQLQVWPLAATMATPTAPAPLTLNAATFPALMRAATAAAPLAGPETGELVQSAGAATVAAAGVEIEDFVARAVFVNPDVAPDQPWDVGMAFREQPSGDHYRITISSAGSWEFRIGLQPPLATGTLSGLNLESGGRNTIELIVAGDTAGFAVNGAFVSALDASALHGASDVWVGSGFRRANVSEGVATRFEDFTVWPLSTEGAQPAAALATPVSSASAGGDQLSVRLHEQADSGVEALAVLHEAAGTITVTVAARGVQGTETLVIQEGGCGDPQAPPAFLLDDFDATGRSTSSIAATLADLSQSPHAIAIRGADDYGDVLACGEIPASP